MLGSGMARLTIPTEPIGSIPRPAALLAGMQAAAEQRIGAEELDALYAEAVQETIASFEATGSPVISDGEQRKPSFATYPIAGLDGLAPDGVVIPFDDGHSRQLPRLTRGPFRYRTYANSYLLEARRTATRPVKQAVISASALSLLYPQEGIDGYSQDAFLADLSDEAEADIRLPLEGGAHCVQIDFTEARLSLKLDPSGGLLRSFVELNNGVLRRFSADDRSGSVSTPVRAATRTRPTAPTSSTAASCPRCSSSRPETSTSSWQARRSRARPCVCSARTFARGSGSSSASSTRSIPASRRRKRFAIACSWRRSSSRETSSAPRDDCGFAPFGDDTSTSREIAFAKIRARVEGTELAADELAG